MHDGNPIKEKSVITYVRKDLKKITIHIKTDLIYARRSNELNREFDK